MTGRTIIFWTGLAALILSGCTKDKTAEAIAMWESPLYRDHPLAGQIWKPADRRHAMAEELSAALKKADYVLIGEKHDNPDHHRLQAGLVAELAAHDRRPALVFEMLTGSQQEPLDTHLASHPGDAAGIGAAVGWGKSGWPAWTMYQPIARQALDNDMPLLAGGIDRDVTRRIASEGPDAMGEGRAAALMLDRPIEEDMRDEMRQVIFDSHCQQLPESMLDPLLAVTLAKDAVMAERMASARRTPDPNVSVLIAGAGHVRADWGVPLHLKRIAPDARIVTVGLTEVANGVSDPAEYAERYSGAMPFDFIWFTARVDDEDPCEAFAEQLQQMRERRQKKEDGETN